MNFTKLINKINASINPEYIGGAINWADENLNGRWSLAIDRFDMALKSGNPFNAIKEGDIYLQSVLEMISLYKASRSTTTQEQLIEQMTLDFGL